MRTWTSPAGWDLVQPEQVPSSAEQPTFRVEDGILYFDDLAIDLSALMQVSRHSCFHEDPTEYAMLDFGTWGRFCTKFTLEQGYDLLRQAVALRQKEPQAAELIRFGENLQQCFTDITNVDLRLSELEMNTDQPERPSPLARRLERVACDARGAWVVTYLATLGAILAALAASQGVAL